MLLTHLINTLLFPLWHATSIKCFSSCTARPHINHTLICEFRMMRISLWEMCWNTAWRMGQCTHVSEGWEVCVIPMINNLGHTLLCMRAREFSFSAVKSFKLYDRMLFMEMRRNFDPVSATSKNVAVNKVVTANLKYRV